LKTQALIEEKKPKNSSRISIIRFENSGAYRRKKPKNSNTTGIIDKTPAVWSLWVFWIKAG